MKQLEDFAIRMLILIGLMALGWAVVVIGLGALGLL